MTDEFEIKRDEEGEYYEKNGRKALRMDHVLLPKGQGGTLQDQDDIVIWTKFNVLLQGVAELSTQEAGEYVSEEELNEIIAKYGTPAGDATRQLRVVTQECVRREMFERRVTLNDEENTDEVLLTWYIVLKQLLEGESEGKWETEGDTNREYTVVVKKLLERGVQMPAQTIELEALDVLGELIKPQAKAK